LRCESKSYVFSWVYYYWVGNDVFVPEKINWRMPGN
jgi:hypothetical protein